MHNENGTSNWRKIVVCSGLCLLLAAAIAYAQPQIESAQNRLHLANLFQCLVLAAALLPCMQAAYGWLREIGYTKRDMLWICLWSLVLLAAALTFAFFYYKGEKDIKVYDFSQYWIQVLDYRKVIANSIPDYLGRLLNSLSLEYSALPAFALQPVSYLLGTSFTGYVQAILVMYYFPAAFFLTIFALRLVHSVQPKTPRVPVFIICLGFCVLTPIFLDAVLQGYLDVVGALVMAIMMNIVLRWDGKSFSFQRNLVLSFLSVLLLLLRRWYAYYIVGFYFAIGVMVLIEAIAGKKDIFKSVFKVLMNLVMIAAVSAGIIYLLNRNIFALFLGNNYGEAYSAYKVSSTFGDIRNIVWQTGYLLILAAIIGFDVLVYHRASRRAGLRLMIAMIVAGALFLMVQSLGPHHRYLLTPTLLAFILVSVGYLLENLTVKKERVAGVALLAFCCMNMAVAFVPGTGTLHQMIRLASTSVRRYPVQNEYYDTIWQIVSDLDAKTGGKNSSVYMLGENQMGPEYFRRIGLPDQTNAAPFLTTNSIVDLRDGFPSQLFFADYVLVPDPLVNTLGDVQQISNQVYDMFLHDPMVAEYYTLETVYEMDDKMTLNLFHKTGEMDQRLIDNLKARLMQYHPNAPFVYEPIYFLALSSFDTSMRDYDFYTRELTFTLPAGHSAAFMIHDTDGFSEMSFFLRANMPGFDLAVENQTGEIYRANIVTAETEYRVDVSGSEYLRVRFSPRAATSERCEVVLRYQEDSLR